MKIRNYIQGRTSKDRFSSLKGRRYFADFQFSRVVSVPINRDNRDFTVLQLHFSLLTKNPGC